MTISYRIFQTNGNNRIEFSGLLYAEDDLHEAIWLVNRELRAGLPKRERIEAQHQITQYETLLDALRNAGAASLTRKDIVTSQRQKYTVVVEQRLLSVLEIEAESRYEAYKSARDLVIDPECTHTSDHKRTLTLDDNQWIEHEHSVRIVRPVAIADTRNRLPSYPAWQAFFALKRADNPRLI